MIKNLKPEKTILLSHYENIWDVSSTNFIELYDYLEKVRNGTWQDIVLPIRAIADKKKRNEEKAKLPNITISGLFNPRENEKIIQHSGFIAIDIDNQADKINEIKEQLARDRYLVAAHTSISGNGLCVIFKINPVKHRLAFSGLSEYLFENYKLIIDQSGINEARARYVSFDPDTYIAETYDAFEQYPSYKEPKIIEQTVFIEDDFTRVLNELGTKEVNICEEYHEWLRIGFAFADQFNEAGRRYYHLVSQYSSKYDVDITNWQFDVCLERESNKKVTMATFYYYCKKYSIDISKGEENQAFDFMKAEFLRQGIYKNVISLFFEKDGQILSEQSLNSIYIDLQRVRKFSKVQYDIFLNSNHITLKNPIKEYFESIKPGDKTAISELIASLRLEPHEHFDKMFVDKFTNPTIEFTNTLITKWLVGIVSSVYDSNYNPLMIVLVGSKNTGKTEWFRRLLPAALKHYFCQSKFKDGKDSEALMAQKLLILNDELDGMNKNDANTFRNFISQDYYTYRVPYGKQNTTVKRLATVCGTSNETEIINDPENNRRIIPVEITGIDYEKYNAINKNELFAEIYELYKNNHSCILSSGEINLLDEFTKSYEINSIERETIQMYFEIGDCQNQESVELNTTEIMKVLQEHNHTLRFLSLIKLGKELKALGFKQRRVSDGRGNSKRVYDIIRVNAIKSFADSKLIPWRTN
jgi:hypothetical protein